MTATRNARRTLQGTVVSQAMEKTITVRVDRTYKHPKYGKYVQRQKKYAVHDETGEANLGDMVEIVATRPISKRKRWRLGRVVERADEVRVAAPEVREVAAADAPDAAPQSDTDEGGDS